MLEARRLRQLARRQRLVGRDVERAARPVVQREQERVRDVLVPHHGHRPGLGKIPAPHRRAELVLHAPPDQDRRPEARD